MKDSRCFSCDKRTHTTYDCPREEKIAPISDNVREDADRLRKK